MRLKKKSCLHERLYTEMVKSGTVRLAAVERLYPTKRFLFCALWAYCYIISGVGIVSRTPHPHPAV